MNTNRLDSLIALLDDPDHSVSQAVQNELLKENISIVDHLEHVWETSLDELVQKRLEFVIQQIQLNDTKEKIRNWADQPELDLFEGFFLISRHQYPEMKLKSIQIQLEKIKKDIWLEFRNSLTSLEKITVMNHIFFSHYKFSVDRVNPESPQNCHLNRILDTRRGNPVSITILYALIARMLQLPVHYIDIGTNPLVGYFDQEVARLARKEENTNPVLFYVNPANNGTIIGPREIDYILHGFEIDNRAKLTEPCPDKIIIKRLIEQLIASYEAVGIDEKVNYLKEINDIL